MSISKYRDEIVEYFDAIVYCLFAIGCKENYAILKTLQRSERIIVTEMSN